MIDTVLETSYGIIFLAGPTGCGKSTTLASLISLMAAREPVNIVTIEDPIEYELLPGKRHLSQREVKTLKRVLHRAEVGDEAGSGHNTRGRGQKP